MALVFQFHVFPAQIGVLDIFRWILRFLGKLPVLGAVIMGGFPSMGEGGKPDFCHFVSPPFSEFRAFPRISSRSLSG